MLKALKDRWNSRAALPDQPVELSATQLMVNIMYTQGRLDSQQCRAAIDMLRERFWLSRDAAEALFSRAVQTRQETPRFEQLILHIRKGFTHYELIRLLQDIRRIASPDG